MRIAALCGFATLLFASGCAAFDDPYGFGPNLGFVCINVRWSTPEETRAICGAGSCAQVGQRAGQVVQIWARRPDSFADSAAVCALGHEVLHSLGATH